MSTTTANEILHPSNWRATPGYSVGVAARGRTLYLGGLIGWNAEHEFETDDFIGQVEQTLRNIVAVLHEGGAGPEHLVRLTWYVTDKQESLARLKELGGVYRSVIGKNFPAMALVQVAGLVEDRAKVEIEATAVIPDG